MPLLCAAVRLRALLCCSCFLACATSAPTLHAAPPGDSPNAALAATLDAMHAAAARADEDAYFAAFTPDAVFLGTDATERWSRDAFRAYAHPHFQKGKAWAFHPSARHLTVSTDGTVAWFDETLETPNLGPARGSGVLRLTDGAWKVALYDLSITIPNERFAAVKRRLDARPAPSFTPSGPPDAFPEGDRAPALQTLTADLEKALAADFATQQPPSLAVTVVRTSGPLLTRALGVADVASGRPATADTIYRIGSITKTFTAEALLALRDEGKLDLDDRLDAWLPEAGALQYEPTDAMPVTLRQLLAHASGLPRLGDFDYTRPDVDVSEAEVLGALRVARVHAPGTRSVYSNFGFSLLGLVVGHVSGRPYRAALTDRLLTPLGMSSSGFDPAALPSERLATGYEKRRSTTPARPWRLGASEGAGGLYASLDDMGRWVRFQLDAWPPRDERQSGPLPRATRREAHLPSFSTGLEPAAGARPALATGLGYAWHTEESCEAGLVMRHGGAIDGFHATIAFLPHRDLGVVVLANSLDTDTDAVADHLLRVAVESGAVPAREPQPTPALVDAVRTWARHPADLDEATYAATFASSFRAAVPLAKLRAVGTDLVARHGRCDGPVRVEHLESATSAQFRVGCEHGVVIASASVQGRVLGSFYVRSSGLPATKPVRAAADTVLALSKKWDDAVLGRAFTPAWAKERDSLRGVLTELVTKHGPCVVDGPGDGDGEDNAELDLRCTRGAESSHHILALRLASDGRIASLFVRPRAEPRCGAR